MKILQDQLIKDQHAIQIQYFNFKVFDKLLCEIDIDKNAIDEILKFDGDISENKIYNEAKCNYVTVVAILKILKLKFQQKTYDPITLLKALGFTDYQLHVQDDADQILSFIISDFEDEYKKQNKLELFKQIMENSWEQKLICQNCNYESTRNEIYHQFYIPIQQNLFKSLGELTKKENIEYKCQNCNQNKFINVKCFTEPQSLFYAFKLNRFVQTFGWEKSDQIMKSPLYIDTHFMNKINYYCDERIIDNLNEQKIESFIQYLLQPWSIQFDQDEPQDQDEYFVWKQLFNDQDYTKYSFEYYTVQTLNQINDKYYHTPQCKKEVPSLWKLISVVKHQGQLNSGHYFTYYIKYNQYEQLDNIVEINDEMIIQQKQNGQNQDYTQIIDYNGYIYLYQKIFIQYPQDNEIIQHITTQNTQLYLQQIAEKEETLKAQIQVNIISNIYKNDNQYSLQTFPEYINDSFPTQIKVKYDNRKTFAEIEQLYIQQLSEQYQDLQYFVQDKEFRVHLLPNGIQDNQNIALQRERQLSINNFIVQETDQKDISIMIEYLDDTFQQYDYNAKYIYIQKVKLGNEQIIYEDKQIIKINNQAIQLANHIYSNVKKQQYLVQYSAAVIKCALLINNYRDIAIDQQQCSIACQKIILLTKNEQQYNQLMAVNQQGENIIPDTEFIIDNNFNQPLFYEIVDQEINFDQFGLNIGHQSDLTIMNGSKILQHLYQQANEFTINIYTSKTQLNFKPQFTATYDKNENIMHLFNDIEKQTPQSQIMSIQVVCQLQVISFQRNQELYQNIYNNIDLYKSLSIQQFHTRMKTYLKSGQKLLDKQLNLLIQYQPRKNIIYLGIVDQKTEFRRLQPYTNIYIINDGQMSYKQIVEKLFQLYINNEESKQNLILKNMFAQKSFIAYVYNYQELQKNFMKNTIQFQTTKYQIDMNSSQKVINQQFQQIIILNFYNYEVKQQINNIDIYANIFFKYHNSQVKTLIHSNQNQKISDVIQNLKHEFDIEVKNVFLDKEMKQKLTPQQLNSKIYQINTFYIE